MADSNNVNDGEAGPPKTAKQLQKEKEKQAKLEKFKQKQEKKLSSNAKDVKEKAEVCLRLLGSNFICLKRHPRMCQTSLLPIVILAPIWHFYGPHGLSICIIALFILVFFIYWLKIQNQV